MLSAKYQPFCSSLNVMTSSVKGSHCESYLFNSLWPFDAFWKVLLYLPEANELTLIYQSIHNQHGSMSTCRVGKTQMLAPSNKHKQKFGVWTHQDSVYIHRCGYPLTPCRSAWWLPRGPSRARGDWVPEIQIPRKGLKTRAIHTDKEEQD